MFFSTTNKTDKSSNKKVRIDVKDVAKSFGENVVLKSVSLSVEPGEIFVLMGPSGSGKSVFLKLLAGLDVVSSGEIKINGTPIEEVKEKQKYVIGLVFQSGALFNSLTVFDNLALYMREHNLFTEIEITERIDNILSMLGLNQATNLMPSDLSGGMKKRVALARGLLMEPDILLFDEPTSELDPITAASIIELIGYVNKKLNITTFVVSHDITLANSIGDHIALLEDRRIQEVYTRETLANSSKQFIKDFFNPVIDLKNPKFLTNLS